MLCCKQALQRKQKGLPKGGPVHLLRTLWRLLRFPGRYTKRLPALRAVPGVDVLADLILGEAVALLNLAFELVAAAVDDIEIVIGELAPLFLHLALDLLPVPFDAI